MCFPCADLQGRLRKATRLKGIEGFKAAEAGLRPMRAETWGPFIFIAHDQSEPLDEWLGEGGAALLPRVSQPDFVHVGQRDYTLRCNWKVRHGIGSGLAATQATLC